MNISRIFFLLFPIWLLALPVYAAQIKADRTLLYSTPAEDDVYLAGGKVIVESEIAGDAAVAGGHLLVNGAVRQDLLIAGGSVTINGEVGGDVRAAGGDVTISRNIAEDLVVFGGNVIVGSGVTVGGDLLMAGGRVVLEGTVEGNVEISGGEVVVNGTVRGDTRLRATGQLALNGSLQGRTVFASPEVILGPQAVFGGDVEYWSGKGAMDFAGVEVAGKVTYNPKLKIHRPALERIRPDKIGWVFLAACLLFSLLSGALVILVLVLVTRDFFYDAAAPLQEAFWKHAGLGFLYFAVMPMAALLLFLSIIGIPLGLFLLFVYFFSIYFAVAVTALVLTGWHERRRGADWGKGPFFGIGFSLFVILKILTFIPVVGWLLVAIPVCGAFGALLRIKWRLFRQYA